MLLAMSLLWFYFTFTEYLVTWYGNEAPEMPVFWSKISGRFAPLFWLMVVCNFLIPFPILAIKKLRTIPLIFFASCCILVGMWLERFLIIVPTLTHPFLPYNYGTYWPSLTEAVDRRRHARAVRPALFPVREVQPDDFDLGIRGRPAGRLEACRRTARADLRRADRAAATCTRALGAA